MQIIGGALQVKWSIAAEDIFSYFCLEVNVLRLSYS